MIEDEDIKTLSNFFVDKNTYAEDKLQAQKKLGDAEKERAVISTKLSLIIGICSTVGCLLAGVLVKMIWGV